jgi:N-acetylneuraminate synthase
MEFSEEQWMGLREHVAERGLLFVGSPFSMEALDLLVRQEADLIKIASGEVYNTQLLDAIAASNIPAVVSSGMSTLADLDRATRRLRKRDVPFTLLQCTSEYPCPAEHVGLNLIPEFKLRYRCPVGLSDHSGTVVPGVVAAYLGIDLLEIHVTMSREMFGPDVVASVTTDQLRDLVAAVRFAEALASNPVNKDTMATELGELRKIFGRSLVAARDLPCGTRLGRADLAARKPGGGLPADGLEAVLGRALVVDVAAGHQIGLDMLES